MHRARRSLAAKGARHRENREEQDPLAPDACVRKTSAETASTILPDYSARPRFLLVTNVTPTPLATGPIQVQAIQVYYRGL